jgi:hypothetical protein
MAQLSPRLKNVSTSTARYGMHNARCLSRLLRLSVSFHGVFDSMSFVPGPKCETIRQFSVGQIVTFTGTYTPHATGMSGMFKLTVIDGGEPGTIDGDFIDIEVISGEYAGYSNAGLLQGGNIQVL